MGRRSRYVAQRRAVIRLHRYAWDQSEPLCSWRQYRRKKWGEITELARLIFNDSTREKQPALHPRPYSGFNRRMRRWLLAHRAEVENA